MHDTRPSRRPQAEFAHKNRRTSLRRMSSGKIPDNGRMTSAGSGDERTPGDSGRDDGRAAASIPEQQPAPTPTRRSPLARIVAALAIVLILVALWVLTWAVVSGALTSDDGPFGDTARVSEGAITAPS
jgi:hypothetical protein